MSLRRSAVTVGTVVITAAILLGAGLRFIDLDWPPLSDAEAQFALPALSPTASPAPSVAPPQEMAAPSAIYQVLTSLIFSLFGAGEGGARLVPACFGALLVALPLLIRRRLGDSRTAFTMLLLALSPTLVAASRSAIDSLIGAFGISLAAASPLISRDERRGAILLGIGGGLTLAAGPSAWFGMAGFLLGAVGFWAARRLPGDRALPEWRPSDLRLSIIIALVTAVGVASGAGIYLRGVSSLFTSLSSWLLGWGAGEPLRPLTVAIASLVYEPLLWFLGVVGAVMAFRTGDRLGQAGAFWAVGEFAMLLIYPGRQPAMIVWLAIPLAFLGGLSLRNLLESLPGAVSRRAVALLSFACIILSAFAILQLRAEAQGRFADLNFAGIPMGLLLPLLAGLLGVALILLFGLGWSWREAWMSAGAAAVVVLLALSVASMSRISFGDSAAGAGELWRPSASTAGIPLMLDSLELASQAQTGFDARMEVRVIDGLPPSIAWALRAFPRPSTADLLEGTAAPAAIAPETALLPEMQDQYIGQTLSLRERWGWDGVLPPGALRWLALGDAPTVQDRWVMLIRADVFGGEE